MLNEDVSKIPVEDKANTQVTPSSLLAKLKEQLSVLDNVIFDLSETVKEMGLKETDLVCGSSEVMHHIWEEEEKSVPYDQVSRSYLALRSALSLALSKGGMPSDRELAASPLPSSVTYPLASLNSLTITAERLSNRLRVAFDGDWKVDFVPTDIELDRKLKAEIAEAFDMQESAMRSPTILAPEVDAAIAPELEKGEQKREEGA